MPDGETEPVNQPPRVPFPNDLDASKRKRLERVHPEEENTIPTAIEYALGYTERELIKGNVTKVEDLKGSGSNVFVYLEIDSPTGAKTGAIGKPARGEVEMGYTGIPEGSYARRERAARVVSENLGFGIVPPTVLREIDSKHGVGSVQEFVPQPRVFGAYTANERKGFAEQLQVITYLDYLIWNQDRSGINMVVSQTTNKLVPVDHGLAFGIGEGKPDFSQESSNDWDKKKPISQRIKDLAQKWTPEAISGLSEQIRDEGLLPEDQIDALAMRVAAAREYVEQNGDYSYEDLANLGYNPERAQ